MLMKFQRSVSTKYAAIFRTSPRSRLSVTPVKSRGYMLSPGACTWAYGIRSLPHLGKAASIRQCATRKS